ncbi:hypothetical protein AAF712_015621 [Marasmius tenuissimus]|uniref:HMG box domain-containing protein n=1 Tax=Marasmius tenuissimus TaxID=585030 RepID=A0ABR2Z9R6_9AGAR
MESVFRDSHSAMYTKATQAFIKNWGYNLEPEVEPEEGKDYTPRDINNFAEGKETEDEEAKRQDFEKMLRGQIANWARYCWTRKKVDAASIATLLGSIGSLQVTQPRRAQEVQYYQQKTYKQKHRIEFKKYWNTTKKHLPESERLNEMNAYCRRKWDQEPEEEKEKVRAKIDTKYHKEQAEYSRRGAWTNDAEGFLKVQQRTENILVPVADGLSKLFGNGVVIFLYGPRANGKIGVDSISSVVPDTQTNRYLKDFDPKAMNKAHAFCEHFAQATFTPEYCKSRIVEGHEDEDDADSDDEEPPSTLGRVFWSTSEGLCPVGANGKVLRHSVPTLTGPMTVDGPPAATSSSPPTTTTTAPLSLTPVTTPHPDIPELPKENDGPLPLTSFAPSPFKSSLPSLATQGLHGASSCSHTSTTIPLATMPQLSPASGLIPFEDFAGNNWTSSHPGTGELWQGGELTQFLYSSNASHGMTGYQTLGWVNGPEQAFPNPSLPVFSEGFQESSFVPGANCINQQANVLTAPTFWEAISVDNPPVLSLTATATSSAHESLMYNGSEMNTDDPAPGNPPLPSLSLSNQSSTSSNTVGSLAQPKPLLQTAPAMTVVDGSVSLGDSTSNEVLRDTSAQRDSSIQMPIAKGKENSPARVRRKRKADDNNDISQHKKAKGNMGEVVLNGNVAARDQGMGSERASGKRTTKHLAHLAAFGLKLTDHRVRMLDGEGMDKDTNVGVSKRSAAALKAAETRQRNKASRAAISENPREETESVAGRRATKRKSERKTK